MRFHWYSPFARAEELDWAVATPRPGESIVLQTIDQQVAPPAGQHAGVTVVRDLPDVNRDVARRAWVASRARTYWRREALRRAAWDRWHFDLVHLHYLNRFTDSFVRPGSPLVMSIHDVVPHRPRLGRAEHAVLARTYHRADAHVVAHESLREALVADFGLDGSRVHVVPLPVFGVPGVLPPPADEPPTVLLFGALRPNKGLSVLLEAARLLRSQDIRVVIAGRGDPGEETAAKDAARIDPRISAEIGYVSHERRRDLFAKASVVVLPYTSFASQSGVLHDAYAQERPVVVTDVGALGRTVHEDGTGLVVVPGDAAALAGALREVLEPVTWSAFARAAAKVRERRSPAESGRLLRDVYDTVL